MNKVTYAPRAQVDYVFRDHRSYIIEHGDDPEVIKQWTWKRHQP